MPGESQLWGPGLLGLPCPQRCQYYHPRDSRTHCPPEERGDKWEGTGPFCSSPGSKRFFPQAIFLICPRSQEGEEWALGTYTLILWFAFGHAAAQLPPGTDSQPSSPGRWALAQGPALAEVHIISQRPGRVITTPPLPEGIGLATGNSLP